MEFDFKEVTTTLVIGGYLLFGLEFLLYIYLRSGAALFLLRILKRNRITQYAMIIPGIVLCFSFGMLLETMSDKYADEDTFLQSWLYSWISDTDDTIKRDALFSMGDGSFLIEAARAGILDKFEGGEQFKSELLSANPDWAEMKQKHKSTAVRMYYHAKNVVYKEQTYFSELQKIQMRIDFSRSFSFVSLLLAISAFATLIKICWRNRVKVLQADRRINAIKVLTISLAILMISFFVGARSYADEERNFDRRTFGYFASLQILEANSNAKKGE
ncbi:MAG: hypothetical protein IPJ30_11995 [Acidobacteria bacterium]|nr:hypothetical protein [Acidobacteriota bacterium]